MIQLNIQTILQHLRDKGIDAQFQQQHGQIHFAANADGRHFPLFLRVDPHERILQTILFLPCALSASAAPDAARLLAYINKEIDMPGFGMDEATRIIHYRCTLPTLTGTIDSDVLDHILALMPRISSVFFRSISAVASGLRFETALPELQKLFKDLSQLGKQ